MIKNKLCINDILQFAVGKERTLAQGHC